VFQGIFESTTIPVLEQSVEFAQARHNVLAGNIANLDTPGYRTRDLPVGEFHSQLKEAIAARHKPTAIGSPGDVSALGARKTVAGVAENCRTILRHDDNNTGIEYQATEMAKNQMQHNLALAIMTNQFQLLQTAISERV